MIRARERVSRKRRAERLACASGGLPQALVSSLTKFLGIRPGFFPTRPVAATAPSAMRFNVRRTDLLEQRRGLMEAWARSCEPRTTGDAKVVELRRA